MGNHIQKSIRLLKINSYPVPKDIIVLIIRKLIKQNIELAVPLWLSCRKLYYDKEIRKIASICRIRSSLTKIINHQYKKIDIEIISSNPSFESGLTWAETKNDLYYDKNGKLMYFQFNRECAGCLFNGYRSINRPMRLSIGCIGYENCYNHVIEFEYKQSGEYAPVSKLEWTIHKDSLKLIIHVR